MPSGLVRALAIGALWLAASCGGDEEGGQGPTKIGSTPIATPGSTAVAAEKAIAEVTGAAPAATPEAAAPGGTEVAAGPVRRPEVAPEQFLPSEENRDPFQAFQSERVEGPVGPTETLPVVPVPPTEDVLFPDRDIKDLQCKMILAMQGEKPRAYLIALDGKTGYVTQNSYIGRPFYVGAQRSEVYWKVYEIMEGGVSFESSASSMGGSDASTREVRRLYTDEELARFADLFLLR